MSTPANPWLQLTNLPFQIEAILQIAIEQGGIFAVVANQVILQLAESASTDAQSAINELNILESLLGKPISLQSYLHDLSSSAKSEEERQRIAMLQQILTNRQESLEGITKLRSDIKERFV